MELVFVMKSKVSSSRVYQWRRVFACPTCVKKVQVKVAGRSHDQVATARASRGGHALVVRWKQ